MSQISRCGPLAVFYYYQRRFGEAEPLFKRSLEIRERALGAENPAVALSLNNLATLYGDQGRYAEAEQLNKRSLAIYEKALGPESLDVANSLSNLAVVYRSQRRYAEAEPIVKRSLAIREKALGPEHIDVAVSLNVLAGLYQDQGRREAEPLFKRGLAIREKVQGPEHIDVATGLNNLAMLYWAEGRYAEAEPLERRSIAIREKVLGPDHSSIATDLGNLAALYQSQGRHAEAEPLLRRSLAMDEKALGPDHPAVAKDYNNLAWIAVGRGDWLQAADHWRRATGITERRARRGLAGDAERSAKGEPQHLSWQFGDLVKATYRLAAEGHSQEALAAEMFETAQWAMASEAAASLVQMAARSAAGAPELAAIVRERQDLAGEAQAKDKLLIAAKSRDPGARDATAETALSDRLAAIGARLDAIASRLAKDFPDYAALVSPAPVSVADVRAGLGADEALVLFLDTPERKVPGVKGQPEESFIWVVTKSQVRWVRSELGSEALRNAVAALRCGLDDTLLKDTYLIGGGCLVTLGEHGYTSTTAANMLPFDLKEAHRLYHGLFGQVEDLIKGRHLLIVQSGALTRLPFQVLVTAPPRTPIPDSPAGYREAAWLGVRQPISVLPAVSSLRALRAQARASRGAKPYLGIGNPLLDGLANDPDDLARGQLARAKQSCPVKPIKVAEGPVAHRSVARVVLRSGLANAAEIRSQAPLPETADELCAVADDLKAEAADLRLGAQATEREVKRLSSSGELAQYRMLHFATHGAGAGDLDSAQEPGLILTPPEAASAEDDGYLSASEIAGLKIDANWVILSACNTAAAATSGNEALSGLGRAFIYAGARALLVSHWAVDSDATVRLVTGAVDAISRDAKVGRAEAMRRSMLALIENGTPEQAHPAFWAPFVVVGEGAAGR